MKISPHTHKTAFSLVEVTIALGVAGFCLLAIFGLLPIGVNSNRISVEQSDAANIAIGVISDLRSTPLAPISTSSSVPSLSPRFKFSIPAPGGPITRTQPQVLYFTEEGNAMGKVQGYVRDPGTVPYYCVSVGFIPPPTNPMGATQTRIMVTWPAFADRNIPATTWPVNFSGSFETAISLNRK